MSQIVFLLKAFDENWSHQCESLDSILADVTSEESEWQHAAYSGETLVQGLPEPGTIRWHVAHLEHCARHYAEILRTRPVTHEPPTPPPGVADLPQLIHRLEGARRSLRTEIERLSDADLDAPCVREMSVAKFLRMVVRHEVWHAGRLTPSWAGLFSCTIPIRLTRFANWLGMSDAGD